MNLTTLYKKLTNGKYIIGLLIGFVGIISFCSAGIIYENSGTCGPSTVNNYCIRNYTMNLGCNGTAYVVNLTTGSSIKYDMRFYNYSNTFNENIMDITSSLYTYEIPCDLSQFSIIPRGTPNFDYNFKIVDYDTLLSLGDDGSCPEVPECPEVNTGEILSGYILESEIDTNYCVGNGLCPNECGSGEEMTGTNRSSLFINNIQYPGAPTIKFTIPEEIQREQNTDEEETNIDVIGYGYDQDKMQQMVNTQYYKPTAEEMSGLMEKVADFLPLVAVALLIIRIRRIVKKVF